MPKGVEVSLVGLSVILQHSYDLCGVSCYLQPKALQLGRFNLVMICHVHAPHACSLASGNLLLQDHMMTGQQNFSHKLPVTVAIANIILRIVRLTLELPGMLL